MVPGPEHSVIVAATVIKGFPGGSVVKNLATNARDAGDSGLIPGSGRSPGGGNGNPLHYSCLGNPMDRGAWWARVHGGHKTVRHSLVTEPDDSYHSKVKYLNLLLNPMWCSFYHIKLSVHPPPPLQSIFLPKVDVILCIPVHLMILQCFELSDVEPRWECCTLPWQETQGQKMAIAPVHQRVMRWLWDKKWRMTTYCLY